MIRPTPGFRIIVPVLVLMHLTVTGGQAQPSDLERALRFYPLEIGDFWQYEETSNDHVPYPFYSIEVVGDTTLANGQRYRVLERLVKDLPGRSRYHQRVDTASAIVFQWDATDELEFEYLKLSPVWADTLAASGWTCRTTFSSEWMGLVRDAQGCSTPAGSIDASLTLTEGLGMTHYMLSYGGILFRDLIYASTSTTTRGTFVGAEPTPEPPSSSLQVFPNPFLDRATVEVALSSGQAIELSVYDMLGRRLAVLTEGFLPAGRHRIDWHPGGRVAPGMYVIRSGGGAELHSTVVKLGGN
ncbi:MAG: hypothetical protein ACI80V_002177 [Rhodothermales bacterium]|jgi:hypothetical protein